jgi:hypothetical protein
MLVLSVIFDNGAASDALIMVLSVMLNDSAVSDA